MTGESNKSRKAKLMPSRRNSSSQQQSASSAGATGCCGRIRSEWHHPAFSPIEVTGQQINFHATFAPPGKSTIFLKTVVVSWSVSIFVSGLLDATPPKAFYFAYLTHCTLVLASLYLIISWWNTFYGTAFQRSTSNANEASWTHNISWMLFALAAPGQIVVTAGYWGSGCSWEGATSDSALEYRNIMEHGGVMVLILLEGLVVNRVPLRLRHSIVLAVYMAMYLIWTFVHAYLDIGDPTSNDDDAIYGDVLQWKNDPWMTTGVALLVILFLAPFSFFIVYGLSLPCGCCLHRRYVDSDNQVPSSYIQLSSRDNKKSSRRSHGIV